MIYFNLINVLKSDFEEGSAESSGKEIRNGKVCIKTPASLFYALDDGAVASLRLALAFGSEFLPVGIVFSAFSR